MFGAEALAAAGLLIKRDQGGYYDRFRDRVMFPIRDVRVRVIGFGGRVIGDDTPKYLNSPETDLFHKGRELYGLYEARSSIEGYSTNLAVSIAPLFRAALAEFPSLGVNPRRVTVALTP